PNRTAKSAVNKYNRHSPPFIRLGLVNVAPKQLRRGKKLLPANFPHRTVIQCDSHWGGGVGAEGDLAAPDINDAPLPPGVEFQRSLSLPRTPLLYPAVNPENQGCREIWCNVDRVCCLEWSDECRTQCSMHVVHGQPVNDILIRGRK